MSILRRYNFLGNVYFITAVSYKRMPILLAHSDILNDAIAKTKSRISFKVIAWTIMPDHLHAIIDPMNSDISNIMQRIKMSFAASYREKLGLKTGRVWQNRFWDHIIRNQEDLNRHIDYIHYNPVKHGIANAPGDHNESPFDSFMQRGQYVRDWGINEEMRFDGEYGE